jgi:exopolyphosphatase/guanosine-5'-triphosphate,3'-diphosphate pyrophosphatase
MQLKSPKIVGFLDLGTNSVRLLVVKLNPNGSYIIITQQKEVIRLGEGEYLENRLTDIAMMRATTVIVRLIELARSRGAEEFIAVATSAAREASNGEELCSRIEELTGVRINIISGTEEARLIWLGVSSGIDLKGETALFIDIGGGSTEIIVGNQQEASFLRSLKLGAIRTTGTHIKTEKDGRVSQSVLCALRRHIEHEIVHITKYINTAGICKAYGSSGTILTLEAIAASYKPCAHTHVPGIITIEELDTLIRYLSNLPLQIRREVQGLNPERADIIIAGAVILHEILKATRMNEIITSTRSLRDGLLVDYISRIPGFPHAEPVSIRERSIKHLGKLCHIDEEHAHHIVQISLDLYSSGMKAGLFTFHENAKELLSYAAYLHDVGQFISFSNHHQHSFYLITEVPLLGFNQHDILLMGLIARYHRKKIPVHEIPHFKN